MKSFEGLEFAEALSSKGELSSLQVALSVTGMAKPLSIDTPDAFLFSPGKSCAFWIPISGNIVDKVDYVRKAMCKEGSYDLVRLHFKVPGTPEATVFAQLLQAAQAETQAEFEESDFPFDTLPESWDWPWTWSKCAKCKLEVNATITVSLIGAGLLAGLSGPGALAVWEAFIVKEWGMVAWEAVKAGVQSAGVDAISANICKAIGKC